MANLGIDAYWEFYREQAMILEERNIVFPEPFAKRQHINELWTEAKEEMRAKAEKAEKLGKAFIKLKTAEEELANAEKELEKLGKAFIELKNAEKELEKLGKAKDKAETAKYELEKAKEKFEEANNDAFRFFKRSKF